MKKLVHNVETGEISEIDLTADEIAFQEAMDLDSANRQAAEDAKKTARIALLERLGITEDEARLLGGN